MSIQFHLMTMLLASFFCWDTMACLGAPRTLNFSVTPQPQGDTLVDVNYNGKSETIIDDDGAYSASIVIGSLPKSNERVKQLLNDGTIDFLKTQLDRLDRYYSNPGLAEPLKLLVKSKLGASGSVPVFNRDYSMGNDKSIGDHNDDTIRSLMKAVRSHQDTVPDAPRYAEFLEVQNCYARMAKGEAAACSKRLYRFQDIENKIAASAMSKIKDNIRALKSAVSEPQLSGLTAVDLRAKFDQLRYRGFASSFIIPKYKTLSGGLVATELGSSYAFTVGQTGQLTKAKLFPAPDTSPFSQKGCGGDKIKFSLKGSDQSVQPKAKPKTFEFSTK